MTSARSAQWCDDKLDAAAKILDERVMRREMDAACLLVRQGRNSLSRYFGAAESSDDVFLLASISKPISVAALMSLFDQGLFQLEDRVSKFIPEFRGGHRRQVTVGHLLTHCSGLPDQLPENQKLRSQHAGLDQFVSRTIETPLQFEPGTKYSYSSMGILMASEIARRISGVAFGKLVAESVFQPLGMHRSAVGLGNFRLDETIRCQIVRAAPESGRGAKGTEDWDWNSNYWRRLGSPWGGFHASAPDVARFFDEFLHGSGRVVKPETARLMRKDHNANLLTPHGLGFALGKPLAGPNCSVQTFGHTGATGTLAWADPATDTVCVVLTTLPWRAVRPHPRRLVSDLVVEATTVTK